MQLVLMNEINGNNHCGFCRNRSMNYKIFYIQQKLDKKVNYNGSVHELFIHLRKPMIKFGEKYCITFSLNSEYPRNFR